MLTRETRKNYHLASYIKNEKMAMTENDTLANKIDEVLCKRTAVELRTIVMKIQITAHALTKIEKEVRVYIEK